MKIPFLPVCQYNGNGNVFSDDILEWYAVVFREQVEFEAKWCGQSFLATEAGKQQGGPCQAGCQLR